MGAAGSVVDASYDPVKFTQSKAIMELQCDDSEKFAKLKDVWNAKNGGDANAEGAAKKEPSPEPQPKEADGSSVTPKDATTGEAPKEAPKEAPAGGSGEAPKEAAKEAPKDAAAEATKETQPANGAAEAEIQAPK